MSTELDCYIVILLEVPNAEPSEKVQHSCILTKIRIPTI